MTKVSNNSTNLTIAADQAFTPPAANGKDSKSLMNRVKACVSFMLRTEARGRNAVAVMVTSFVEMGYAYSYEQRVTGDIDAMCTAHGVSPINLEDPEWIGKNPNIFLPMMKIVDGSWRTVVSKSTGKTVKEADGTDKKEWVRNRSFEKYAGVIRFFVHNEISADKVFDILMNDDVIEIDGFKDGVKPRIMDIVEADRIQQNGVRRKPKVWTKELKTAAGLLKPLATIKIPQEVQDSIKFSDGYAAVIVRVEGDELCVVSDSGLEDENLYRMIKKRVAASMDAEKQKADTAKVDMVEAEPAKAKSTTAKAALPKRTLSKRLRDAA